MDIKVIQPDSPPPTPYAHSLSMVIKSFKGRRDVEVHLFRATWDATLEESIDWNGLVTSDCSDCVKSSRKVILESFSSEERDRIINYLKEQYSTRLTAIRSTPLTFPVPAGLSALSQLSPDKSVGFIEFEKIPSYSLNLPLKGFYDLSAHPPLVAE
ncbi:hypothetical protein [Pseudodesulfovibrio sp. zrk46]|uniref:hypothetical protein n=1 Tax=Pseudodesulfovibrio sp. zrk46 TaxID=2725288 RepID=UPI0014494419|nr:hypothetical protein [Pseudodesulfovibrio sp. zrk46]QJB57877.1 hypothetical protein HFN16_16370 [Pseudodesulfovibrio sp. zrk46]